jgi:uncharacterized delta-60 repeat protein
MIRYNNDGTPDTSFNNTGKVATNIINNTTYVDGDIAGFGLQADNKIIACGRAYQSGVSGLIILRYTNNGTIDSTFGTNSIVFIPDNKHTNFPLGLVVDSNNQIIIIAAAFLPNSENSLFKLIRFSPDGDIDQTFGDAGTVLTELSPGTDVPRAIKIDTNNNLVVGGFNGNNKFVVVRYLPQGIIDSSFANNGVATIEFNANGTDTLNALAIQEDGKIVAGGDVQVGSFGGIRTVDFGLARLLPNGTLDTTFNKNGHIITSFIQPAASSLWALALQNDGKIIAVGDASVEKGLAMARYNSDGSPDKSFGTEGQQITPYGRTCHWEAVALQEDGKIVVAGYIWNKKHYDIGLARYHY